MAKLMIMNLGLDEDTNVNFEHEPLLTYQWNGYINVSDENGMAGIVSNDEFDTKLIDILDEDAVKYLEMNCSVTNEDVINDLEYFHQQADLIKAKMKETECVLVSWSVEYDINICIIYGGTNDEIMEWLNRPFDESDFED